MANDNAGRDSQACESISKVVHRDTVLIALLASLDDLLIDDLQPQL